MERYLAFVEGTHADNLSAQVHDLIRQLLPRGLGRIVPVAARLGISRRTLHRRLAAEGTSFEVLVQQVRIELAHDHLAVGRHSMTEISELLGFAHLSGFSRWRRRWLPESSGQACPDPEAEPPKPR
jgi:AraC-like DNA-binding protein